MVSQLARRDFLKLAAGTLAVSGAASQLVIGRRAFGDLGDQAVPAHRLVTIAGSPAQRGESYGRQFAEQIKSFYRDQIEVFVGQPATAEEMRRFAATCAEQIALHCPIIHDEIAGIARGAGMTLEEVTLLSAHEELYHRGQLPSVPHCTAVAVGPPLTGNGHTYVGQTWDWMPSVYGLSQMLHWKRTEGPSVLGYGYPGMWIGAGLNSAGLALCWTSANLATSGKEGPQIGIPSYAYLTHLLYQDSLDAVVDAVNRLTPAGFFTFVLGDGDGNLLNVEATAGQRPTIERHRGNLVRVDYGSHERTGTPAGEKVKRHERCDIMDGLLTKEEGRLDRELLGRLFGTHEGGVCNHSHTLDGMVFDTTQRTAWVTRGPACSARWQEFRFDDSRGDPSAWQPLFDGKSLAGWEPTNFGGQGDVEVKDGAIYLAMGSDMTGITSARDDLPNMSYEISLEAQRVKGSDFFCGLTFPVGESPCSLIVGGWGGATVGLSSLDGADASQNETTRYMSFERGRWYRIRLAVMPERITAWIDDEQVVDVATSGKKISIRPEVDRSRPLGVASWCTTAAVRDLKIRKLP